MSSKNDLAAQDLKLELVSRLKELIRLEKQNLTLLEMRPDFTTRSHDHAEQELYQENIASYSARILELDGLDVVANADAPHDSQCASRIPMKFHKPWACDCWKGRQ